MRRVLLRAVPIRQCRISCIAKSDVRPAVRRARLVPRYDGYQSRTIVHIPTVLLPPVVFAGLVVALWTWKCFMMVAFQNKIIFMPGLPPNARRETIEDYRSQCGGIEWREERTKASDGTTISLCVASVDNSRVDQPFRKTVYILYFQGNASSIPSRLPFLSPVLRILRDAPSREPIRYTMVCCSYRGYWTSRGRPSEKGIAKDAMAALNWIRADGSKNLREDGKRVPVAIWGQSIGAGVTTGLAAEQLPPGIALKALILETPFLSVRAMLETLYPQKWLPYRHLWPFLRNHFDSSKALEVLSERSQELSIKLPEVLIVEAGKDELVPIAHGDMLERRCIDLGLPVRRKVIDGALHTEAMARPEGRLAVVEAIKRISDEKT